jgi:hypothetical protein
MRPNIPGYLVVILGFVAFASLWLPSKVGPRLEIGMSVPQVERNLGPSTGGECLLGRNYCKHYEPPADVFGNEVRVMVYFDRDERVYMWTGGESNIYRTWLAAKAKAIVP